MHKRSAFTLIELLVVISIIGILAALVISQLGDSRIKARNAQAQSDISEMGKAVESFKNEDLASERVISNVPGSTDTLQGSAWSSPSIFTGTQNVSGPASTYAVAVLKTPSSAYMYRYVAPSTQPGAAGRQLVPTPSGSVAYSICTNLIGAAAPYYCSTDGGGTGQSANDQVRANQGLGNLSAAATNSLGAWYKLDGSGTSTTATDSSGNGNDGAIIITGTTDGWVPGKFGNALLRDRSALDRICVPKSPSLAFGTNNFTFAAWIKTTSNPTDNEVIFDQGNAQMYINAGKLGYQLNSTSNQSATLGGPLVNDNTWHHVVTTFDRGGSVSGYVDGALIGTNNISSNTGSLTNSGFISIAGWDFCDYSFGWINKIGGTLDDLRIYTRALSASDVAQLYAGTL